MSKCLMLSRHRHLALQAQGLRNTDSGAMRWLDERAEAAAGTKQDLADIISVLLEELVEHRHGSRPGAHRCALGHRQEALVQPAPDRGARRRRR